MGLKSVLSRILPGERKEANLGTLTDEEWREAHEKYVVGAVPDEESWYIWQPGVDKTYLIPEEEREDG